MKKETAIKKLEKVAAERMQKFHFRVKGTAAWNLILRSLESGNPIRPCSTSGSGRYIKNLDYTSDVCNLLNLAGIKFSLENDAPRGGLTGNKITLTHIEK